MCGIAGIHVKERALGRFPVDRMVDHLLLGIEPRGDHATGYVAVSGADGKKIALEKKDVAASEFVLTRKLIAADTKTVLLHTRWATQGSPTQNENNHPVLFETCFAVHNGHISNDDELFAEMGVNRPAEVDSVAIPACLKFHGMGEIADIKTGLEQLQGGFAIAAIDPINNPGRLVLAKGMSSPLMVLNHPDAIVWASTLTALRDAWGAVLGTPPTAKMTLQRKRGLYDFGYGDLWVIDGDEIQQERFSPAVSYSSRRSGSTSRFQGNYYGYDDAADEYFNGCETGLDQDDFEGNPYAGNESDWERRDHGWEYIGEGRRRLASTGGALRVPQVSTRVDGVVKKWTCSPASWECKHPCTAGCTTPQCDCYTGNPNHPRGEGSVIDLAEARNARGRDTRNPTLVEAECYSCRDDFPIREMEVFVCSDGAKVNVCEECRGWEKVNEGDIEEMHDLISSIPTGDDDEADAEFENALKKFEKHAAEQRMIEVYTIKEVAFELNTSVDFIDWILYKATDEELEDAWLADMKGACLREYDNARQIVLSTRKFD